MRIVPLNFKVDELTKNGRIYPKDTFVEAMNRWMDVKNNALCFNWNGATDKPSLMDMIGRVNSYDITSDGRVLLTMEFLPNIVDDIFDIADFTIASIGKLDEDKTVTEFRISHAYITPKEDTNGDTN